jgi:UDP-3-O-[3-hydroxymyristoyl] N-acetylglucosamine deacetylase
MNNRLLRALLDQPASWDIVTFEDVKQAPAGFDQPARAW